MNESCVALLLGSNQGDAMGYLAEASKRIGISIGHIIAASEIYKTAPWGKTDQPEFLNQLLLVEVEQHPSEVMERILAIELEMGRIRDERWGPRIIDIDLLYAGSQVIDQPGLRIPHPALSQRRFALAPLSELIPDFIHPELGVSQRELLDRCNDTGLVEKVQLYNPAD
ncbi:MAG: 2-amino-4-hydroxy-6-hydroxymethyldihydropteridine diphosphokinase [Bacteroidota bacterium]